MIDYSYVNIHAQANSISQVVASYAKVIKLDIDNLEIARLRMSTVQGVAASHIDKYLQSESGVIKSVAIAGQIVTQYLLRTPLSILNRSVSCIEFFHNTIPSPGQKAGLLLEQIEFLVRNGAQSHGEMYNWFQNRHSGDIPTFFLNETNSLNRKIRVMFNERSEPESAGATSITIDSIPYGPQIIFTAAPVEGKKEQPLSRRVINSPLDWFTKAD